MDSPKSMQDLMNVASIMRGRIIERSHLSGLPHLGSCLSCVDLLVALYFHQMKINPENPGDINRDRFILSKGHGVPALFQALAMRGYFPISDLDAYGEDGGVFGEHPPTPSHLAGIEAATGSLGHGLPLGLGMAIASRVNQKPYSVYVILGDGECNEGSVWESALLAAAQKVSNLCVIIDFNKWQATDRSEEVMALNPLVDKWKSFGWNALEIDGHNFNQIIEALKKFPNSNGKPLAIIAHTIKGKGVSFMEDDNNWHYRIPSAEEVSLSKIELGLTV